MTLNSKRGMPDLQRYPLNLCVFRVQRYVCVNVSKPGCFQLQIPVYAVLIVQFAHSAALYTQLNKRCKLVLKSLHTHISVLDEHTKVLRVPL